MHARLRTTSVIAALIAVPFSSALLAQQPAALSPAWHDVEQALGRSGSPMPGDVARFAFPRSDLSVTIGAVPVKPALALGSWVAFKQVSGGHAMAMGDLVLTEDEVAPVMLALQKGGVQQTALHNHLQHESPRVMYMHISAHGDASAIARAIHDALALTKTPLAAPAASSAAPALDLDTAAIARTLRIAGKPSGGVYQVSVPRRETIHEGGEVIPPSMGVATAINFQPTGGGRAVVTGDFVMLATEVDAVIRALEAGGISPTALHSHMTDESPRLLFMHFWGDGSATSLATTLAHALDVTASKR